MSGDISAEASTGIRKEHRAYKKRRRTLECKPMEALEAIPEFGIHRENEERRDGGCGVVFDPKTQLYAVGKRGADGVFILFSGGVDANEDIRQGVLREVTEESGLQDFLYVEKIGEAITHFHNVAKNVDRIAHTTCFLAVLRSASLVPTQLEVHEQFTLTWVAAREALDCWRLHNQEENYSHWIYFLEKAVQRAVLLGYDTTSILQTGAA